MKYGEQISNFLEMNREQVENMLIDGHPTDGFLKVTLKNGDVKIFNNWDPEDQGLFSCYLHKIKWKPGIEGLDPTAMKLYKKAQELGLFDRYQEQVYKLQNPQNTVQKKEEKKEPAPVNSDTSETAADISDKKEEFGGVKRGFFSRW